MNSTNKQRQTAVLLPTFNALKYLPDALSSLIDQTYQDFDIWIYDDASTDGTEEYIGKLVLPNLFYVKNEVNLGLAKTLSKAIHELGIRYTYIARMDADDWAYPDRLKKQIEYLNQHPSCVLCGTQGYWLQQIQDEPEQGWTYPLNHLELEIELLFTASFGHSSIVFRSDFLHIHHLTYNTQFHSTEDWELWMRIGQLGKMANLPDFLMKYRIVTNSNHRDKAKQKKHLEERSAIICEYWNTLAGGKSKLTLSNIHLLYHSDPSDESIKKSDLLTAMSHFAASAEQILTIQKFNTSSVKQRFSEAHLRFLRKFKLNRNVQCYNEYAGLSYSDNSAYVKQFFKSFLKK